MTSPRPSDGSGDSVSFSSLPTLRGGAADAADFVFRQRPDAAAARPLPLRTRFDTAAARPGEPVRVRLGRHWFPGDGDRLLEAVAVAEREHRALEVTQADLGVLSLVTAACAENPRLRARVLRPGVPVAGRRPGARFRWSSAPHWEQVPDLRFAPLSPGTVAVSGGLGGIGLRLAAEFAALGHGLVLIDRVPQERLPPQRRRLLARIRSTVPTTVVHADLDRWDPAELTSPSPRPDRVRHLVHAAGELRLAEVRRVRGAAVDRAARVRGSQLTRLVEAFAPRGLCSVLVLGSAESRTSHRLFGLYGFAHECLRAAAGRLAARFPDIRFTVAEWTLWSEVGMAAGVANASIRKAGFATVSPAWGARTCVRLLAQPPPRAGVAAVYALGGPRLGQAEGLVGAVTGIGGAARLHPRGDPDAALARLLRACLPLAEAAPPPLPRLRRAVTLRALVEPDALRLWSSSPRDWTPDGVFEARVPL